MPANFSLPNYPIGLYFWWLAFNKCIFVVSLNTQLAGAVGRISGVGQAYKSCSVIMPWSNISRSHWEINQTHLCLLRCLLRASYSTHWQARPRDPYQLLGLWWQIIYSLLVLVLVWQAFAFSSVLHVIWVTGHSVVILSTLPIWPAHWLLRTWWFVCCLYYFY